MVEAEAGSRIMVARGTIMLRKVMLG